MTDDLRTQIRRACAEADGFTFDSLEPHDYQQHADKVLALVQPIADDLAIAEKHIERGNDETLKVYARLRRAEGERDQLRSELRDAEAQRDPLVVNEASDSYLIGRQVASVGMYNTVLRRAMKAEAERDGRREVKRSQAEAAVVRVRDWLGEWGPQLPDGACHTLDRALGGDQPAGRYASQVNAPLHPATAAALNEHLASGNYPVRKVPHHAEPLPAIDGHAYIGPPTFGQRCQDGPAGATCGGLFEHHVMREPCYHLDSKQLGTRPGDLSVWCACGVQVSPGLRTTPNNPPASSDTANNPTP